MQSACIIIIAVDLRQSCLRQHKIESMPCHVSNAAVRHKIPYCLHSSYTSEINCLLPQLSPLVLYSALVTIVNSQQCRRLPASLLTIALTVKYIDSWISLQRFSPLTAYLHIGFCSCCVGISLVVLSVPKRLRSILGFFFVFQPVNYIPLLV